MNIPVNVLQNFDINMSVEKNDNFNGVEPAMVCPSINEVTNSFRSFHLANDRADRLDLAFKLNKYPNSTKDANIDRVFLVDKNHRDGAELHCVSKRGIIFILNERKFLAGENSFITALIARPNQVRRLYEAIGLEAPKAILEICSKNERLGLNK